MIPEIHNFEIINSLLCNITVKYELWATDRPKTVDTVGLSTLY
jgi:hypothetical protein